MENLDLVGILVGAALAIFVLTFAAHQALTLRMVRSDVVLIKQLVLIWARLWGAPTAALVQELRKALPLEPPQEERWRRWLI